jgi:hypothetical protein
MDGRGNQGNQGASRIAQLELPWYWSFLNDTPDKQASDHHLVGF